MILRISGTHRTGDEQLKREMPPLDVVYDMRFPR
jgi:hypothetical protein